MSKQDWPPPPDFIGRIETAVLTLTEFLLARIAEDEAEAEKDLSAIGGPRDLRAFAECEAKRRIVALDATLDVDSPGDWARCHDDVLVLLALPYADHPDYDEAWKP